MLGEADRPQGFGEGCPSRKRPGGVKVIALCPILQRLGRASAIVQADVGVMDEQCTPLQAGRAEAEKLSLPDCSVTTSVCTNGSRRGWGIQT